MSRNPRTRVRPYPMAAVLAVALALSGCSTSPESGERAADSDGPARSAAPSAGTAAAPTPSTAVGKVGFPAIPDVVAGVDPSVLTVAVGTRGIGSGVVYRDGGYVVTNAHVVGEAKRVELELADGTRTPAEVLATDEITDLAVLRAERRDLPPARFATELPRVGSLVLAMGSPLGFQNSATAGIVSGLGREIPGAAAQGARSLVDLIQTDAAISPGNSGGALVNIAGEVVGINEAYIPPRAGAVSLGFAIPALTVTDVVDELIADGTATHPFFGVSVTTLTPQVAQAFGIAVERGVLIQSVQPASPAAAAGLEPGDVMVTFAGNRIGSVEEFLGELRGVRPGDTVEVVVQRGADTETVQVRVGELDPDTP